jgi:nucleoid-associated protein YgaU
MAVLNSALSISPFERHGEYVPLDDALLTQHVFSQGDTLSGLAHRHYDDWRLWRIIADRNGVKDPRRIEPGTTLLIPAKPAARGFFESY